MKAATFGYPRVYTVGEAAGLTRELDENEYVTESARWRDDFPNAAVDVAFDVVDGRTRDVGILPGGGVATPVPATVAAGVLEGTSVNSGRVGRRSTSRRRGHRSIRDLTGTAEYRRQLVETLTHRAIREALEGMLAPTSSDQEAR